jgi:hypothetical protein
MLDRDLAQQNSALQKSGGNFGGVIQTLGFERKGTEEVPSNELESGVEVSAGRIVDDVTNGAARPRPETGKRRVLLVYTNAEESFGRRRWPSISESV